MLLPKDPGRRTEDVLRSLGAFLDLNAASAILITQSPDGLLVRARVPAPPGTMVDGGTVPLEHLFDRDDQDGVRLLATARRGSGVRSGPIEVALRVIGQVSAREGREDLMIAQDGGDWWLRFRVGSVRTIQHLSRDDIRRLDEQARATRTAASLPAIAETV